MEKVRCPVEGGIADMKLWEALQMQMDKKGAKVVDVVKGTGLPYTTIDSILKKRLSSTSIPNAFRLAAFFGLSLEEFVGDDSAEDTNGEHSQRYSAIQELVAAARTMTNEEASRLLDVAKAMLPHRFVSLEEGDNGEEK